MPPASAPEHGQLPTSQQLLRSTIIALAVACVLLVTVVMPAEYGLDPSGIGRLLGLKKMGEIKSSLQAEATPASAPEPDTTRTVSSPIQDLADLPPVPRLPPPAVPMPVWERPQTTASSAAGKSDVITFTLKPGDGAEVKLVMRANARVDYDWQADGGVVNYDTHGDPVNATKGFYHGYKKGRGVAGDKGELVAAFDGKHGWFWRNRSAEAVRACKEIIFTTHRIVTC